MSRTLVFDTETTGLVGCSLMQQGQQPHITEFYGAMLDWEGKQIDELESLINPGVSIPEKIVKITGIDDAMVKDAPTFSEFAPRLLAFIERADVIVAHNLSFDRFMIQIEMARTGTPCRMPEVQICTVEATEWMLGFRLSQTALHEHLFGEAYPSAHRARNDVVALVRIFKELRERGDV